MCVCVKPLQLIHRLLSAEIIEPPEPTPSYENNKEEYDATLISTWKEIDTADEGGHKQTSMHTRNAHTHTHAHYAHMILPTNTA